MHLQSLKYFIILESIFCNLLKFTSTRPFSLQSYAFITYPPQTFDVKFYYNLTVKILSLLISFYQRFVIRKFYKFLKYFYNVFFSFRHLNQNMAIAQYIISHFEEKYGPSWHCIVSDGNLGFFVRYDPSDHIYFSLGSLTVFLFKNINN